MQNRFEVAQDIVISETDHFQIFLQELRCSALIGTCVPDMAITIKFDDNQFCLAVEIDDKRWNGMLTTKLQSREFASAERVPQLSLRNR